MSNPAHQPPDSSITRLQSGLMGVLAVIFVCIGITDDARDFREMLDGKREERAAARAFRLLTGQPQTILRLAHRRIRKLLVPAESAMRRLIVALAADLPAAKLSPSEVKRLSTPPQSHSLSVIGSRIISKPKKPPPGPPKRMPRFALLDPMKRFGRKRRPKRRSEPRIWVLGFDRPPSILKPPQTDSDMVSTARLMRRVAALTAALDDLPGQARRLALWKVRRDLRLAATCPSKGWIAARRRALNGSPLHYHYTIRREPLRPGRPPGSPALRLPRDKYESAHILLGECASKARWAVTRHHYERRDSS